jgi:hypothetical protein
MRLFLILFVIAVICLNFLVDSSLVFLLALSTFPATIYLLLAKTRKKQTRSVVRNTTPVEHRESKPQEL